MPGNYLRLIVGLLIFLGLMLLIGKVDFGSKEEAPLPASVQAQVEAQRKLEAEQRERTAAALNEPTRSSNPYLVRYQREGADCHGDRASRELDILKSDRERLINAVNVVRADDESTLEVFTDITNPMVSMELTYCLGQARTHLYQATQAARDLHRAERLNGRRPSDAEIRNAMDDAMKEHLEKAEQEFALVEESLQQPE